MKTPAKSNMLGLRTTIYKVPDLSAARDWYQGAFGVAPYFDEPFYVGFNIGGFELGLVPEEGMTSASADNVLAYWGVLDIQAEFDRMVAHGATVHEKPTNVGGELMVAAVRDPWGNAIGLIYNPDFKILPD